MFEDIGSVARLLFWFAVVIGLAYASSRLLARRMQGWSQARRMQIIESIAVGPRRHLCLIRVHDRVLCLGVTDGGIAPLMRFDAETSEKLLRQLPGAGSDDASGTNIPSNQLQSGLLRAAGRAGGFAAALGARMPSYRDRDDHRGGAPGA
ncbi:MAG: flagellar biosynthetic protein FliO [Thermaerobacterales bacterium]